jgi:aryl-alcohol dehydrogenase-like predicted oxidoreductase
MTQTSQQRFLGATGLEVSALGVGTNRWGTRRGKNNGEVLQTFQVSLDAGLTLFDTAEVYSRGASERVLGECISRDGRPVVLASKFAPLPGRLSPHALMDALDASLSRLNVETIDLYYVHWPTIILRIDALMDMMALAVRIGRIRAVGVSNYSVRQMRQAAARLARYGIPLAANEVHYSLLHRQPETNGVLEACRELNVALVAYRPLESGLLKTQEPTSRAAEPATPGRLARLPKPGKARQEQLAALQGTLNEIARGRGASVSQVALNWLLRKDEHVIPIPGSTNARHAAENVETLTWQLSDDEFAALDKASQFARK